MPLKITYVKNDLKDARKECFKAIAALVIPCLIAYLVHIYAQA